MNKDMLKHRLAARGFTMYDAVRSVNTILDIIIHTLEKGESVKLSGFGTFHVKERPARSAHNPKTLEPATIGSCKYISFRPGKPLRKKIN